MLLSSPLAVAAAETPPQPTFSWGLAYRARPELRLNPSFEREPQLDEGEPADQFYVGSRLRACLGLDIDMKRCTDGAGVESRGG